MMYGDIACIQRIESIITLKKNRLWNSVTQPTFEQFGIYYVPVNRYSGKHDEAINQIVIPNL